MLALSECSLRPKGLLDWLERSFASLRACPEQREGVTPIRISQLVNGQRAITVDNCHAAGALFWHKRSGLAAFAGSLRS